MGGPYSKQHSGGEQGSSSWENGISTQHAQLSVAPVRGAGVHKGSQEKCSFFSCRQRRGFEGRALAHRTHSLRAFFTRQLASSLWMPT